MTEPNFLRDTEGRVWQIGDTVVCPDVPGHKAVVVAIDDEYVTVEPDVRHRGGRAGGRHAHHPHELYHVVPDQEHTPHPPGWCRWCICDHPGDPGTEKRLTPHEQLERRHKLLAEQLEQAQAKADERFDRLEALVTTLVEGLASK